MKLIKYYPTKEVQYYDFTFTVPEYTNYSAVDEDGTLMGFENEPKFDDDWKIWIDPDGGIMTEMGTIDLEGLSWKNTLQVLVKY